MIADILQAFLNMYRESGDELITDNHKLDDGTYVLISNDGAIKYENILEVNKKNYDEVSSEKFVVMDYLSKLLEMNKPIDNSKTIHSNNYYSFWIKKDKIEEKLNNDIIDGYYNNLLNPKKTELYSIIEKEIGLPDGAKIKKYKAWIKDNIFNIIKKYGFKDDKNYIKIFFEASIEEYDRENKRYMLPNIYNSKDYNIKINDIIYGMPNNNIGLNPKKPYLDNKNRKITTPYLISQDEVLLQKKLFDYLYNLANKGYTNIYVDKKIKPVGNTELLDENFCGYFLRLKKGKEVEIHDFDNISFYTPLLKNFKLKQVISVDSINNTNKGTLSYGKVYKFKELQEYINTLFFSKFLVGNFFTDAKDIKLNDSIIKEELIKSRTAYFNWFYKGYENSVKPLFKESSLRIIKNSVNKGYDFKALEQLNLRESILEYFGGDSKMAERLDVAYEGLRQKAGKKEISSIISDDEYYFAVGQVVYYLLSQSQSTKRQQSLINPIINSNNYEILLQRIKGLYKKYNYKIEFSSLKFSNLYGMILRYIPKDKRVNDDVLLAGFLCKNIIYEKEGGK
ncbi:type I-B CRISPR-associated protein Cas8b/Csh1 [Sedimentibacter sp. MB31-C6]|uniref:type I-B CRISPR-associated protein Cas8b/Csh1 n=1 Tax=Sedimentibacter sp. MB31-C6 TaxID=3109366 RepID=UPI002DDCE314|nr:type I-B CRISPR-associated protein Cas8b/Csh1 [Sedimentibacter sp. MB36-C1]WSI05058.1 type I-B CRISPR-associated protein Cas8b/Csh1 [Sedimentibacter sp. MB36-C1]